VLGGLASNLEPLLLLLIKHPPFLPRIHHHLRRAEITPKAIITCDSLRIPPVIDFSSHPDHLNPRILAAPASNRGRHTKMARLHDNNFGMSSSSSSTRKISSESTKRSNTQASAYVVDASTMSLTGYHFSSSCGAGGGE